ncbi:MAG: hypothetical protein GX087_07740 [Desulfobulbaceae bacterium]|nr:hypothetical protein [Desulfobulbaceae bacterium]
MTGQSVRFGAWLLIGLHLLMAFGSIWIFMRMAPAIEVIIARNVVSIEASEEMLAILSLEGEALSSQTQQKFLQALERAKNNITESEEAELLTRIEGLQSQAFAGDSVARNAVVHALADLGHTNRKAMRTADIRAQQLGMGGAWAVVFMASASFLVGMLFLRGLKKNLLVPLEEIHAAVTDFHRGNTMRRCSYKNAPKGLQLLMLRINELMDGHALAGYVDEALHGPLEHTGAQTRMKMGDIGSSSGKRS